MIDIEHPDHTGASANPFAPWNQDDAPDLICSDCDEPPEDQGSVERGDPCQNTAPDPVDPTLPPCQGHYRYRNEE